MTRKSTHLTFALFAALAACAAEAQGLSRARSTLQTFQSELMLFVPIVAVISLVILGVLWGLRVIYFRQLAQWGGGILIVGAASQVVNMLMS
jgi:type IV secretory pathway VirB2 component (pilin)